MKKRLRLRLKAVWSVLTKDFLLISDIKRYQKNGEPATSWSLMCRTPNEDEHDFLVLKGALVQKYRSLPLELQQEQVL